MAGGFPKNPIPPAPPKGPPTVEELESQHLAALRLLAVHDARENLLDFMKLTMPDPVEPDNPLRTRYEITPQARLLAEVLEKVERGELLRVCISIGPQLGKSQIISRGFPPWFSGRNPYKHMMLGTYNQDFADDFGGEVREIMMSPMFKQVFPEHELRKGSKAKDELITTKGGKMAFLGRGGSGTGKPADIFLIDDPIKDDKEAQSDVIRADVKTWFKKVAFTRLHGKSAVVIVHTRWSEDDLIGSLVDPAHPEHDPEIARNWTYINIPAVVRDESLAAALGLKLETPTDPLVIQAFGKAIQVTKDEVRYEPVPMAALWERKPLKFLAEAKKLDPRGFEALYMGNPAPEDGDYFKREWLIPYKPSELPKNLRKYGCSDHAISEEHEEKNDRTCALPFGIDSNGEIWILPDVFWKREGNSEVVVEEMIDLMDRHKMMAWWAERGHITKAIRPILVKRMLERRVYTMLDDSIVPSVDKRTRARSVQGLMSMRRVHFPVFAPWWPEAQNELLKFPNATHDDFVDALAWVGICALREIRADRGAAKADEAKAEQKKNVVAFGSPAWLKSREKVERREQAIQQKVKNW